MSKVLYKLKKIVKLKLCDAVNLKKARIGMRAVEELLTELKEELKKDMPFARHRLLDETTRTLEQLARENRVLRNTVQKLGEMLKERGKKNGST